MKKKLYRSKYDKKVCGVCGGIAKFVKLDSIFIRIIWISLICFFGVGLLFYFLAAIIMPEDENEEELINPNKKTLYRSTTDVMISGVCGGIAEYFKIDVTIIRLIWALFICFGGTGIIAYIAMCITMPVKGNN